MSSIYLHFCFHFTVVRTKQCIWRLIQVLLVLTDVKCAHNLMSQKDVIAVVCSIILLSRDLRHSMQNHTINSPLWIQQDAIAVLTVARGLSSPFENIMRTTRCKQQQGAKFGRDFETDNGSNICGRIQTIRSVADEPPPLRERQARLLILVLFKVANKAFAPRHGNLLRQYRFEPKWLRIHTRTHTHTQTNTTTHSLTDKDTRTPQIHRQTQTKTQTQNRQRQTQTRTQTQTFFFLTRVTRHSFSDMRK